MWEKTGTFDVRNKQCEDGTVKCEKKVRKTTKCEKNCHMWFWNYTM